ncbi:substrate-binding domain-containing protein [Tindallia californiensis]|uniref:Tungstate transport system substrate-binding protein n=1 Tax=Tindallia californiensis TaxID=159292 RepID=A0A1H3PVH4_9FIRM|nr:substrate-binding domain-containing protein [Tindallia californiensis]SDZ05284.1 tungstate transport system substrate-binding protein [Tindallia californiensis]
MSTNPKDPFTKNSIESFNQFHLYLQGKNKKQLSTDKLFLLLEKIEKEGSISKAAADLKLSYRYAWGLIQDAEKAFSMTLLHKKVGGSLGGGASLTKHASEMLRYYHIFRDTVQDQLHLLLDIPAKALKNEPVSPSPSHPFQFLLLASTMEPIATGLLDRLEKQYYQQTGVLVRHVGVGSGKAMEIGKKGGADLLLVHSPSLEKRFMQEGWGAYRKTIMTNQYLLVGPTSDPAGLGNLKETAGIHVFFRQLALTQAPFLSRNDGSGTHAKEKEIWESRGSFPKEPVIIPLTGVSDNIEVLSLAIKKSAYALTDSTSYRLWKHGNQSLTVFFGANSPDDTTLANPFSIIVPRRKEISTDPYDSYKAAMDFVRWLADAEGKKIIENFPEENGEAPYFDVYCT